MEEGEKEKTNSDFDNIFDIDPRSCKYIRIRLNLSD